MNRIYLFFRRAMRSICILAVSIIQQNRAAQPSHTRNHKRKPEIAILQNILPIADLRRLVLDYVPTEWKQLPNLAGYSCIWFLSAQECMLRKKDQIDLFTIDTHGQLNFSKTVLEHNFSRNSHAYVDEVEISADGQFLICTYKNPEKACIYQLTQDGYKKIQEFAGSIKISKIKFSPRSNEFAFFSYLDAKVHVWQLKGNQFEFVQAIDDVKKHYFSYMHLVFSPDGNQLAIIYDSTKVKIFRRHDNRYVLKQTLSDHSKQINASAFSHDSNYFASCTDRELIVYEYKQSSYICKQKLAQPDSSFTSLAFSPCGTYCASSRASSAFDVATSKHKTQSEIAFWSLNTGSVEKAHAFNSDGFGYVTYSPDGLFMSVSDVGSGLYVWVNQKKLLEFAGSEICNQRQKINGGAPTPCIIPAKNTVATDSMLVSPYFQDKNVQQIIISYLGFELLQKLDLKLRNSVVAFSPDNCLFMGGEIVSNDKNMYIAQKHHNRFSMVRGVKMPNITSMATCKDKNLPAFGCVQGSIYTSELSAPKLKRRTVPGPLGDIISLAISATGNCIAAASGEIEGTSRGSKVFVSDYYLEQNKTYDIPLFSSKDMEFYVHDWKTVALSPDGSYMAVGTGDMKYGRALIVFKNISNQFEVLFMDVVHNIKTCAFSPDGNYIAAGTEDGTIVLYTKKNDTITFWATFKMSVKKSDCVNSVVFSPDGNYLYAGSTSGHNTDRASTGVLKIWQLDTADPRKIQLLQTDTTTSGIYSLASSPNGRYIAAGLLSGTVNILNNQRLELACVRIKEIKK